MTCEGNISKECNSINLHQLRKKGKHDKNIPVQDSSCSAWPPRSNSHCQL